MIYTPQLIIESHTLLRDITTAIHKHVAIQVKPLVPFQADTTKEPDAYIARILVVGFANMFGIHHAETCSWLCCEDCEYRTLLKKYNTLLCLHAEEIPKLINQGIAGKYILKYRKVANELGLRGVPPYAGSKDIHEYLLG